MTIDQIKTVVVIGAGAMGQQIAMNTALNGRAKNYKVIICDSFPSAVEKAQKWAAEYLKSRVAKCRITQEESDQISENLSFSNDVDASAAKADFIIEAIIEDLKIKRELFQRISKLCKPDTIIGTNSSNMVSSKFADVTTNPERLLNVHYFNPALVMKLVEIVRGPHTSENTIQTAKAFAASTGKSPIIINKEIPGFVANRINAAVTHEACSLLEKGIASVEDIDTACEKGLNYPMGPFKLMDLTGIDVNYYVRRDRYAESGDEYDKPSPLVIEKFKKGEFGRKTGKGWYDYTNQSKK
ncbi:MAG: 3-hydroxyacyl-CoA dehydrogenase family protein [Clostridiales bacterium]|jgi:3-hydroxybutyryl-CoA dehydrogenase|nr:3-hydroxyacyl-CoA dehydrogenase family protein [Clostridiales bacterium]MCI2160567.1 3-hydroxyacyl-CoA dehydrogenase family protein [Oscillospiraceae bacterium]MCI1962281.1 3-hydroxyacyl-CoA dehydrogenase family protein [Clostridiales bacterium]MCI2022907.1 3-hydroxyacyl-CoA dehydrogenase family protein [Clostridiales bacterium]MCI2027304.1 3-hydroxyacyl-CoA dehydrogenase family protein [Clostridiales bacterium]